MEDAKTVKIDDLKARIARADYDVDVDAVADVLVARIVAVHAALRRADVRELLADVLDDAGGSAAQKPCS